MAHKGYKQTDAHKAKYKDRIPWNKGKKGVQRHSVETRKKISISGIGRKLSAAHREHVRLSRIGMHHSAITCTKIGNIHRGVKHTVEQNEIWRLARIKYLTEHPKVFKNTKIEQIIERELRLRNIKYTRQYYVKQARHIVDFFIEPNIVIECDGDYYHCWPGKYAPDYYNKITKQLAREHWAKDAELTCILIESGFEVYRFWEHEIYKSAKDCVENIVLTADKFGL
jgi:very-short-patch-repair endonuclease